MPVVGGVVLVIGLAVALGAGAELGFQIQSSQSVAAGRNGGRSAWYFSMCTMSKHSVQLSSPRPPRARVISNSPLSGIACY